MGIPSQEIWIATSGFFDRNKTKQHNTQQNKKTTKWSE